MSMTLHPSNNVPATELAACADEAALRAWHTKYFGKKGEVQQAIARLKDVPPAEKPAYGKEANRIKDGADRGLSTRSMAAAQGRRR